MNNVNSSNSFLSSVFSNKSGKEDFDYKADRIIGAVASTSREIAGLKEYLKKFENNKSIKSILKNIEKVEGISKKFLTPGEDLDTEEVKKMVNLFEKLESSILKSEKEKIGEKSLKEIIEQYRQDQVEIVKYSSLSSKLLKLTSKFGSSAKDFLIDNAKSISLRGEDKKSGAIATLSSISPVAGLLSKVVSESIDLDPLFENSKSFLARIAKTTSESLKSKLGSNKIDQGSKEINATLTNQYEEDSKIETKRHSEIITALKKYSGSDNDTNIIPGFNKTSLKKLGKFLLKVGGIVGGGFLLSDAFSGVKSRKGESFFGTGEGEQGLLGSRASRYAQGALGGAVAGAAFGPIGALIGGSLGALTTLWADKGEEISSFMKEKFEKFIENFSTVISWIKEKFQSVIDAIKNPVKTAKKIYSKGKEIAVKSWDSIKSATSSMFNQKTPVYMQRAMKDLGITKEQAAGIFGNLGHESAGLQAGIQEKNPLIKGSRGGLGWGQWTGERRKQFEEFSKNKGLALNSDEANYQFLIHELKTSEKGALKSLKESKTAQEATIAFEKNYERAGVKHYDSRLSYAKAALNSTEGKVENNNELSTTLAAPSKQEILQESSNNRLDSIQKTVISKPAMSREEILNSSMSSYQKQREIAKLNVSKNNSGSFSTSNNMSPETYLNGLQLGIT